MAGLSIAQRWAENLNRTVIIQRLSEARLPSDAGVWLKAVLLAALAAKSAQLLWVMVTPVGPLGGWRAPTPAVLSAEAQAALFATVNPFDRGNTETAVVAALPTDLKLFGVRDNVGSSGGGAIVALPDGTQLSVSVGETLMPGVVLVAVGYDFADVERGGARQRLFLDQDKPPETLAPGASPAAAAIAPATAGLTVQALRGAVSFSPRQANGAVSGILVAPGGDAATFATTGFQAGDVIVSVNGARIASLTDLAQLQQSLTPGASLSLTVERAGRNLPLTLKLAGS